MDPRKTGRFKRNARAAYIALGLVLAVLAAGCSSNDDDSQPTAPIVEQPTEAPVPREAPTPATTPEPEPTEASVPTPEPTPQPTPMPTPAPPLVFTEFGDLPVGVRTLELGEETGEQPLSVWYPADSDAVAGMDTEIYDSAQAIPAAFRALIPESMQSAVETNSYRDAPLADGGPYPVVIYSHGFGGHRDVAIFLTAHLASHGFVVASPEHIHRNLPAQAFGTAEFSPEKDQADVANTLAALETSFGSAVDTASVGVIGHSAGARTALDALANEAVLAAIPLAGGGEAPP